MAITKNVARQEVVCASVEINYSDLTSGVDYEAINLPLKSVLVGGQVTVLTAFNSATSDVIDVGDAGSQNRYLNDGNIHATGCVQIVNTGTQVDSTNRIVTVRWVGVGAAPSAGKVRLDIQYYIVGRSAFTQD